MAGQSVFGRNTFLTQESKPYVVETLEFLHTKPWKEKTFLVQKYVTEGRSIAQIARETLSSRAAIRRALIGFGIKRRPHGKPGLRPAQVPYGYRRQDGLMVPHDGEQRVLSVVEKMSAKGMPLRQICEFLSATGVPTKRRGQRWHPEMIRRLLSRPSTM